MTLELIKIDDQSAAPVDYNKSESIKQSQIMHIYETMHLRWPQVWIWESTTILGIDCKYNAL